MKRAAFALGLLLVTLALAGWRTGWLWFVRPTATELPARGIDVSHHQGDIDWARVARDDVDFAWIKATEGGDWTDPRFEANRRGAAAAGVSWGAYHFFTFCRAPAEQAAHFLAVVGEDRGELPPAVDVESGGNCSRRPTPGALRADLVVFLDAIEPAFGREAVLYVIDDQLTSLFGAEPPPRALWIRSVRRRPVGVDWVVWQWHPRGWVRGIAAFTDLNVLRDEAALDTLVRRRHPNR